MRALSHSTARNALQRLLRDARNRNGEFCRAEDRGNFPSLCPIPLTFAGSAIQSSDGTAKCVRDHSIGQFGVPCFGIVAISLLGFVVPLTYSVKEAAERLGVSKRWLQQFLRKHPADKDGVPFYVPFGNRKKLTERDLERILEKNRNTEKDKLLSADAVVRPNWTHYRVYEDSTRVYEDAADKPERPSSERLAHALVQLKK